MFEITLKVSKITVLTGRGPDRVILHTNLRDGCWPYTGLQTFECQVGADQGVGWVDQNLGRILDEVIYIGVPTGG